MQNINAYFHNQHNFYRLQLNVYCSITFDKTDACSNKKKDVQYRLELLSNEILFQNNWEGIYTRFLDFYSFYWKLQRLLFLSKYCKVTVYQKNILMVAESEALFNLIMYFSKKYNQQFVFSWIPGLLSNAINIRRFYLSKFKLFNLIDLSKNFDFVVFIENSDQSSTAFKEITSVTSGFPFVLFSTEDNFFSPSTGFLTGKSELKVYFYLSIFFSFFSKTNYYYSAKERY